MRKLTAEIEEVGGNDYNKRSDDIPLDDIRRTKLSEDESSDEVVNPKNTSFIFLFRKSLSMIERNIQHIINTILVQDDNLLYGRGTFGTFSGFNSDRNFSRLYSAGVMLCLANCGFTGICLTICVQLIQQYILKPNPIQPNFAKLAFENDRNAIQELYKKPYYMHFILLIAFWALITLFNCFGKRIIKWICWVPSAAFVILSVEIFIATTTKIIRKDADLRCIHEPVELIPKDRYYDQIPVLLYLSSNYTMVSPIHAITVEPSIMKHFCKYPFHAMNCTFDSINDCQWSNFRLKTFEWNFKAIKSNLRYHIIDISNINRFDWRDIIYDIYFFESIFISDNTKFASIIGCSLLLLPLFTGSICGINISSTLKSPTKNIPTGIFSSLFAMIFLITLLTCALAFGIERHLLLDKFGYGTYPSFPIIFTISHPIVLIIALMLMSTVAAIQSMYTAKSLLLSIITSHSIPLPRFFYQRTSKLRKLIGIIVTAFLTLPYLLVDSLDHISIIASSCILTALIAINLGTIICSMLNFPSFQPTFRYFRSFLAMFGIIACTIMLYGCKPEIGMIASTIGILIYVIFPLHRRRFHRGTPYAIVVDIANMLLYSSTQKNIAGMIEGFGSKPRCIVFTKFPAPCDNLLRMAKILSQNRSALCLSLIRDTGDQENIGSEDVRTARQYMEYIDLSGYATQFKYQKISSLHSIASALASCCGLGVFQSNTVMIEYLSQAALNGSPDSLLYHYHMHRVCVQHCNLIVIKGTFPLKIPPVESDKTIDIWWIIDNGDVLLMVAKMLKQHKIWHKAKLRLFVVVDIADDIKRIEKALFLWLIDNHYLLYKIEFIRADSWIISDYLQLRSLQIKRRYNKTNDKSLFSYLQRLIGIPDGKPVQNAVDSGFHGLITNSIRTNSLMKIGEQQRARQLNKEILVRSSDAVLVLMNIPEPPVHLERFWKYLSFLNDISNELKKVLFVRGIIDCEMKIKEQRIFNEQTSEDIKRSENIWARKQILLLAFLCRIILIYYGHVHDYLFEVRFTDIDYKVYSDAAEYVCHGRSPYERVTYRYTPLLAWLLIPVVKWPDFGKILFCAVDVVVGFLYFQLSVCNRAASKNEDELRMKKSVVIFWLANPLTAVISSRGNADALVCATVLWTLYLLKQNQLWLAALVYGLLAVQLKLYPIIYLPSIFLSLSNVSSYCGWIDYVKRLISNVKGYIFILIFSSGFLSLVTIYYVLYGMSYIKEALFYHLYRTDTRHNFSPYFYILYLATNNMQLSRLISFCAFIPQASLIIWLAFRFHDDLPFCWLLTTIVFVSFNKVCTSQYFIWYLCLLPIAQRNIEMSTKAAVYLMILWFLGQAFWLYPAYLFEFRGKADLCIVVFTSEFVSM
ncbi:GPI mannosyltransferase [Dirofilaria immitis]